MASFSGGTGDDVQDGTPADDLFDYSQGGHDTLNGLEGNDTFIMGGAFDAGDRIDGGVGYDVISLDGNYATGIALAADTIQNIEEIDVAAGHSYKLTFSDANVRRGSTLTIDGSALGASDVLTVIGASVSFGSLIVTGGAGNDSITGGYRGDTLLGGDGNDTIVDRRGTNIIDGGNGDDNITASAQDFVTGGEGSDIIVLDAGVDGGFVRGVDGGGGDDVVDLGVGARVEAGTISGGAGFDTVHFGRSVTFGMPVFDAASSGFETIGIAGGVTSATIYGDDDHNILDFASFSNIAGGHPLIVFGLGGDDVISAHSAVQCYISGGDGADTLIGQNGGDELSGDAGNDKITGGKGDDRIEGGAGRDKLAGNDGSDILIFNAVSDSTGSGYDHVKRFNAFDDRLHCPALPSAIDASITTGTLSRNNAFNSDLAAAVDATHLGAGHAVLFTPDSGTLAGQLFLIVDVNGVAGYQADEDSVIRLIRPHNMDDFGVGDFM